MSNFIRASICLTLVTLGIFLGGYLISSNKWGFQLYEKQFNVAGRFAKGLARAQLAKKPLILIFGSSTVAGITRPKAIKKHLGDYSVNKTITAGGSIYIFESLSDLIVRAGLRPDVSVVGFNLWQLSDRCQRVYSKSRHLIHRGEIEFFSFLSSTKMLRDTNHTINDEVRYALLKNSLWPWRTLGYQLSRLSRYYLFRVRMLDFFTQWLGPTHRRKFSYFEGELVPHESRPIHNNNVAGKQRKAKLLKHYLNRFDVKHENLVNEEAAESMRRTVKRFCDISKKVVIVLMPHNWAVLKGFSREVVNDYKKIVRSVQCENSVEIIDYTRLYGERAFSDYGHLQDRMAGRFNKTLGRDLKKILEKSTNAL